MNESNTGHEWVVEAVDRNIHVVRFPDITAGWTHRVLLTGDRHWDNPHSDQELQRKHLEAARELNAPVIDVGDFFCLMQGRYDPRRDAEAVRPEHQGKDYFDRVRDTAAEFFGPYADQFAVIGMGNHETSILKHNQINMIANLTKDLQRGSHSGGPFAGQYAGWVFFRFYVNGTTQQTMRLKYHHGHGGGGPVTKGIIQTNRRAVFLPDADIVVTGHIHEAWTMPITRERVTNSGRVYLDQQWHISVPTYKDEYGDGGDGWHIETGKPPKPVGCAWLEFELPPGRKNRRIQAKATLDI